MNRWAIVKRPYGTEPSRKLMALADSCYARGSRPVRALLPGGFHFALAAIFFLVLVPEPRLAIGQLDRAALNIRPGDARGRFQHVAGGDDQRGIFAGHQRADPLGRTQDFSRP